MDASVAVWHPYAQEGPVTSLPEGLERVMRLPGAVAALLMGTALYLLAPLVDPYLTRSLVVRAAGLAVLVGGGALVYGLACLVTGAFSPADLKALLNRRAQQP